MGQRSAVLSKYIHSISDVFGKPAFSAHPDAAGPRSRIETFPNAIMLFPAPLAHVARALVRTSYYLTAMLGF
jgi:hypothetical protein